MRSISVRRRSGSTAFFLFAIFATLCCVARLGLCAAAAEDAATERTAPTTLLVSVDDASTFLSPFSPSGKDFPNPTSEPTACNRGRPSWICDPDGIISKRSADELEGILRDIAQAKKPFAKSACSSSSGQRSGFQVALAALSRFDLSSSKGGEERRVSSSSSSAGDAAAEFASKVMDLWGVGEAGCDDGVVVVLAKEDRQSYILAGRGALPKLPPKASSAILEAAKPLLRAGDVSGALKQIVVDVGLTLAGAPPPEIGSSLDWGILLFLAVVLAIVVTSARAAAQQRAQQRAASEAIEKLRREQAAAEAAASGGGGGGGGASAPSPFASSSCPVCLEDFTPVGRAESSAATAAAAAEDDGGEGGGLFGGGGGGGGRGGGSGDAPSAPLLPGFFRSSPAAPPPPRRVRPLTMHCGHVFCGDCISRWTDGGHDACPICRAPLAPAATAAAAPAASSSSSSSYRAYPNYRGELAFRLGSLHRLYPAVVTAEVLSEWLGQARRGAPLASWESVRAAQLADSSRIASRRRSEGARFGAVGGFGGGSSAGGGGAGSSW